MKKVYFKLIGLLSLNINSMEKECLKNPSLKNCGNKDNFSRAFFKSSCANNSDSDVDSEEENGIIYIKKIEKITETPKKEETYEICESVESLLNFFELMNISINLDYGNYKEYKSSLNLYNAYIVKNFKSTNNLVPLLTKEAYEFYIKAHKELNQIEKTYISLKNKNDRLIIDINSHIMTPVIENFNTLKTTIGIGSPIVTDEDIYEDIFFAHKIFNSLKEHLICENSHLLNKNKIKNFVEKLLPIVRLLEDERSYKEKNVSIKNLLKTVNYFANALDHFSIKKDFALKDLDEIKNFFTSNYGEEKEIVFLLKTLIKTNFKFNQKQFICPGLTELLVFKKDFGNNIMDFEALNQFIRNYWNICVPTLTKITNELEKKNAKSNVNNQNINIENILLSLNKNKDFNNKFNEVVEKCILPKNQEIILDSKEILLSVSLHENENNIFFISSSFIKTLLELNENLIKDKSHKNLNDSINELGLLMGNKNNLKYNFIGSCLKGVLFADSLRSHLNPMVKNYNGKFIKYLTNLHKDLSKIMSLSYETSNKLLNIVNNLLELNKNMKEQENVINIKGLTVKENSSSHKVQMTYVKHDGNTFNEITLNHHQFAEIHTHKNLKEMENFTSDIFQIHCGKK